MQSPTLDIFRTQLHKASKVGSALSGGLGQITSRNPLLTTLFSGSVVLLIASPNFVQKKHQSLASSIQKGRNGVRQTPGFVHWHPFQKLSSESPTLSDFAPPLPRFELQLLSCPCHSDAPNWQ